MSTVEITGSESISEEYGVVEANETQSPEAKKTDGIAKSSISIIDYFYGVNPVHGKRELRYLPTWVEKVMGSAMYPMMVINQGGSISNHFELPKVSHIMGKLKAHARRDLPYEVKIINKDVVNAWCLPGGKIAIYKRILERIDYFVNNKKEMGLQGYTHPETGEFISYADVTKEDVIAALLGHEMTHADARHSARKLERSFIVQAGIFTASAYTQSLINGKKKDLKERIEHLNKNGDMTSTDKANFKKEREKIKGYQRLHHLAFNWLVKLGVELYFLMGSRHHELEADKYGTRLAAEAGYNPAGALFLQELLKRESKGLYDYLPNWFQKIQSFWHSHPPCTERQAALFADVKAWKQIKV